MMTAIFSSATFWLFVSMAVFFAFALKPLRGAIAGMLDREREQVRAQLDEATRLRAEAESSLKAAQEQQAQALRTAEQLIDEARKDAEALRAQAEVRMHKALADREAQALAKIAAAEEAALRDARAMAAQMAIAASAELIRQKMTAAQADALVEKAILDVPNHIN